MTKKFFAILLAFFIFFPTSSLFARGRDGGKGRERQHNDGDKRHHGGDILKDVIRNIERENHRHRIKRERERERQRLEESRRRLEDERRRFEEEQRRLNEERQTIVIEVIVYENGVCQIGNLIFGNWALAEQHAISVYGPRVRLIPIYSKYPPSR